MNRVSMQHEYFQNEIETRSLDEIQSGQLQRLQRIVHYVYDHNPIQRQRLEAQGLHPRDIQSLADLSRLPFTGKEDLRNLYPLQMVCVEKSSIVEMHMSSGSTGTPVVMPYTRNDLRQWGECMARCYRMAGVNRGDVIQITPSFGLFNGGFGFYHGASQMDLFVIPTGAGNTQRQITLARDFNTRVLTGVVSYGIRIMEVLQEKQMELPDLKIGIFGAETFSDSMKTKIRDGLRIEVFDIYGMTETGGVGTLGMDCQAHEGIHVWEDHYILEIIDPKTGKNVEDGNLGELVVTALTREALPLLRFRTGDLTRIRSRKPCACGRTHVRIDPITGRVDDMIIVKGVNFFPKQVEQALMEIPGVGSNYQIIVDEIDGVKDVHIHVEAEEGVTGFTVEKQLKEALGFSPKGDVFPIGHLPRQAGKAKRVFTADEVKAAS